MANAGDPVTQTAVTALAWDPAGKDPGTDGLIALGIMNSGFYGYMFDVNADGTTQSDFRVYTAYGGEQFEQVPLSVAIGRRPTTPTPVAGFGQSNSTLQLVDTTQTGGQSLSTGTLPNGGVAVNTVPRSDGSGGTDWAVATQNGGGDDDIGKVVGVMFEDIGTTTLKAQNLAVDDQGKQVTQLADAASYRKWFPGYKLGRIALINSSAEEVTVKLASDSAAGAGCWYEPSNDPNAFPDVGVVLEPGQTQSQYYTVGAYTAGVGEGGCSTVPSPQDKSGAWRGYLSITPTDRRADARLVNVQLNRNWTIDAASDQTGGSITLTPPPAADPTPTGAPGMPYGYQTFTIGGPPAPVPVPIAPATKAAPTLTVHKLSGPTRNIGNGVYRLDVGSTAWTFTGSSSASPQIQAVIPPYRAQGLFNGNWFDLGGFLPPGPLRAKTTTDANHKVTTNVTVSPGTFYWENPWGTGTQYTQLRITLGADPDGVSSSSVTLAGAPTYGTPVNLSQMTLTPPTASANPVVPNGVDAAQVTVAITPNTGATNPPALPPSDPTYKSVYYRAGSTLITNLYDYCPTAGPPTCKLGDVGNQYDSFIGVQPSATAYPGGGQTATRRGALASYDYVSNTLTKDDGTITITGYVGLSSAQLSTPATLGVSAGTGAPNPLATSGDGRNGFSIEGCNDFNVGGTCVLPTIVNPDNPTSANTSPALYQAGSSENPLGPLLGMQLMTQAQTAAVGSLPLIWTATYAPTLASSVINAPTAAYAVQLAVPDRFPSYTGGQTPIVPKVDATVVSHGVSVTTTIKVPAATSGQAKIPKAKRARR